MPSRRRRSGNHFRGCCRTTPTPITTGVPSRRRNASEMRSFRRLSPRRQRNALRQIACWPAAAAGRRGRSHAAGPHGARSARTAHPLDCRRNAGVAENFLNGAGGVRAIQDSNLWPLAPEWADGASALSTEVQAIDNIGDGRTASEAVGRGGLLWMRGSGTPAGPGEGELSLVARPVEPLLSVREVASRLRVSTATVYRLCDRGELIHIRVSNAIRVPPADLEAYLARG